MEEILNQFTTYLKEYYDLRNQYSYYTIYKQKTEDYSLVFANSPESKIMSYSVFDYITKIVEFLGTKYHSLKDNRAKLILLHTLFDDLDLFILNENTQGKNFLLIRPDLFINTTKYWKKAKIKPTSSYSKSFPTFGLLDKEYPVNLFDLDELTSEIGNGDTPFFRRSAISIGIFPLSKDSFVNFSITKTLNPERNTFGFVSQSIYSDIHNTALKDAIEIIRNENLDIACFPELLICEESLNLLETEIKSLKKDFFILMAGSFHRKLNEAKVGYQNSAPIIIYSQGQSQVFYYNKLEPFTIEAKKASSRHFSNISEYFLNDDINISHLMEDIVPDTSCIVFTCRKFGSFGVVICKDFLTDDSKLMANYRKVVDHLFVISLNINPSADFLPRAEHLLMEHGIASFYVNAYSFDNSNKSPSFYLIPPKSKDTFESFDPSKASFLVAKIQERQY